MNEGLIKQLAELSKKLQEFSLKTGDDEAIERFYSLFPKDELSQMCLEKYCLGNGTNPNNFCRWLERGLESAIGRYSPGNSERHIIYLQQDGEYFKHKAFSDISNEEAMVYVARIHQFVADADTKEKALKLDEDGYIYSSLKLKPRYAMSDGRKLRVLATYYPEKVLPISSANHLNHFLIKLGIDKNDVETNAIARMYQLFDVFTRVKQINNEITPYGFMKLLYSREMGLDPRIDIKINEKLSSFFNEVGEVLKEKDLHKVSDFIVHEDTWEEVPNRIKTIQLLNEQFNKKEWDFDGIKKASSKSVLLSGAVGLSINVNTFFKHPEALECLKKLLEHETPPANELIDQWITRITEIAFFNKEAKPSKAGAALFTSVLLVARYPEYFVDFRQNRWKSLVDLIGLDDFQGEYGERLIYAGQIAKAISQTKVYQQYFPTQYANGVIGALAYLIHKRDEWFKEIESTVQMDEHDLPVKKQISSSLNQILYGPPGTGKTYKTAKLAVEICDGHADQDRDVLMQRYTELTEKNQIGFVTFHQSYSYEDFVEGIRPVVDNTDESQNSLAYTVEDGIFKQMCSYANNIQVTEEQAGFKLNSLDGRAFYKVSVGGLYDPHVEDYCFEHGYISLGYGGDIDYSVLPKDKKWETVRDSIEKLMDDNDYKRKSRFPIQAMAWFKNYIETGDIVIVSIGMSKVQAIGVVTGEYEYKPDKLSGYSHFRKVDWIVKGVEIPVEKIQSRKFSQQTLYSLDDRVLNKEFLESILCNKKTEEAKNHVLIIDEINRANISKVFGELITLLETDKRAGAKNALSVKLPYSRESFSIPDNLFVIGTMNTADRSIALLDTALRRRFEFKELMPDYTLDELSHEIEGIHLVKLLKTINDRIEYYFDREHTIGHAYLIGINNFSQLKNTLLNKIIPLLQEYFYEDWEKVSLVLGETNNSQIIQTEKLNSPDEHEEEKIRYKINQRITVENIKRIYSSKGENSEAVESSDNL